MPLISKRPSDNVLSHWFVLQDKFQFSTDEFYTEIEKELAARQAPGLTISRVEFHEGSALSDKRVYLRLARERFAFDVCAAPFGRTFFFSLRFVEKPRPGWIALLAIVVALFALGLVALIMRLSILELLLGAVVLFLVYRKIVIPAMQEASKTETSPVDSPKPQKTIPDFDGFLLDFPVIGEWYERFRKDTYYRHDTRMMYLTLMTDIVKMKVEEVTAAKGVKLIQSYERSPILKELYEREIKKPGDDPTNT